MLRTTDKVYTKVGYDKNPYVRSLLSKKYIITPLSHKIAEINSIKIRLTIPKIGKNFDFRKILIAKQALPLVD